MLQHFLHFIFPQTCITCFEVLPHNTKFLCPLCIQQLPVVPFEDEATLKKLMGRVKVSKALAYLKFNKKGIAQKILHELKYQKNPDFAFLIGNLFYEYLKKHNYSHELDLFVPVPLHPKRLKERGYNQAEFIAKGLAEPLGIPVVPDGLKRTKEGATQTRKGRIARLQSIENSFIANPDIDLMKRRIGLVDDVITTGATLEACAKCLLQAGAKEVIVLSLAVA